MRGPAAPGVRPEPPRETLGEAPIPLCVISAAYPAPSEPTRAAFVENLCLALAGLAGAGGGRRFEVAVVAPRIAPSDPLREARGPVSVRRFSYPSGGKRLKETGKVPVLALFVYLASGFRAALSECRRTRARAIHCHWVLPAGLIGAAVSALRRTPLVVHAHGSDVHRYARGSWLARRLARWVVARSARVLPVSAELSRVLAEELGARPEGLAVLPMGIDGSVFPGGDREAARAALGLDGSRAEVLFAGDLVPEKGILGLAREVLSRGPRVPPLRLNVAGDGPDRPRLEGLGREAPERVRWLGRLAPGELARWYRAADLLVLPSEGEGAPVSVMEALASGLPVAATAVGGIPELVRPGIEGWLAPAGASSGEFLDVVLAALRDPPSLEKARQNILRAREDRSAARRAIDLAAIIDEVLAPTVRPSSSAVCPSVIPPRAMSREPPAVGLDSFWASEDPVRASSRSTERADRGLRLLAEAAIRGGRLLDLGCGPGWALARFSQAGFEARGLDASSDAVARARARGLRADVLDIEREAVPSGFRVIAALEVLEHLRDPLGMLEKMARALEPGGRLLVSLPNELHLPRRLAILAGKPGAAGHRKFGGHDDPHLRFFTPRTAVRLFAEAGLPVEAVSWIGLSPPRWKGLLGIGRALAALRPSLFALCGVWLLRPAGGGNAPDGGSRLAAGEEEGRT